jgi:hypothetical protein
MTERLPDAERDAILQAIGITRRTGIWGERLDPAGDTILFHETIKGDDDQPVDLPLGYGLIDDLNRWYLACPMCRDVISIADRGLCANCSACFSPS